MHTNPSHQKSTRKKLSLAAKTLAGVAASALLLTACAPGGSTAGAADDAATVTQEQIDEAMSTPTTLEFWSWVPDIQNEIDAFEEEYPEITVNLSNQGGATAQYQKLRTAIASGDVPDVAQIEYSFLPSFTLDGSVLDLAPQGFAELEDSFIPSAWSQVATGDAVWGLPQDVGPTGTLYRTDIFDQAGIEVPASWDEFEAAAQTMKDTTGSYITNLPGNSFSPMMALLWQAGAKPFAYDGKETVTIDLQSDEVKQVVEFWNDLIQKDLVSTDNQLDDNWYQSMSAGKYASWFAAAWGPVFLQGTAANTSGLWQATELPQWDASAPASGNQGGSADVVLAASDNEIVSAQFIKFLNEKEETATRLATEQFLFPSNVAAQGSSAFIDQELPFYANQKVNKVFTDISATVDSDWQWLPYNDYASASFKDTLGKAIADKTDLMAGLELWESQIRTYGEDQGFTVN